jgi:DNA ligase D-like protein (predicted 3'-phosphoesterase)
MYSGRKQRLADWAGIDADGPRQQVPDARGLSEKVAVNRGNGASPGHLNRSVPPSARIPTRPGDAPSQGMPAGQGVASTANRGRGGSQRASRTGERLRSLGLHPGRNTIPFPGNSRPYGTRRNGGGHTEAMAALPRFVVQLHDATTLHFDFRLQAGGVLRSWAVPRGPSLDPAVRRLAVPVEDHTLAAGEFEGVHEGQARGSGAVIIWDEGTAEMVRDEPGHVSFVLHGRKLTGGFALTRTGERRWILVKVRDEAARPGSDIVTERPASVRSGRTWQELRRQAQAGQP